MGVYSFRKNGLCRYSTHVTQILKQALIWGTWLDLWIVLQFIRTNCLNIHNITKCLNFMNIKNIFNCMNSMNCLNIHNCLKRLNIHTIKNIHNCLNVMKRMNFMNIKTIYVCASSQAAKWIYECASSQACELSKYYNNSIFEKKGVHRTQCGI